MLKGINSLFGYIIINIISFISPVEITKLKIGLKNQKIFLSENTTRYEIKTNYLHLKIIINNFDNIIYSQIADKIVLDPTLVRKCSYSSYICQSE